jgi:hypothetical protein
MIYIPPKIILKGDKRITEPWIGSAKKQLNILEEELKLRGLNRGTRRRRLSDKIVVVARVLNNFRDITIEYSKAEKIKEKEKLQDLIPRFFVYLARKVGEEETIVYEYHWIYFAPSTFDKEKYNQTIDKSPVTISEDYIMFSWPAGDTTQLELMKNQPIGLPASAIFKNPHRFSKAFMLDGRSNEDREGDVDGDGNIIERPERWVAAPHLLTKDRATMFLPLHAYTNDDTGKQYGIVTDICDILDTDKYPDYPLPFPNTLFLSYKENILFTGLKFPAPPRHFYCNTEEGIMVWYGTNVDYGNDNYDYIGGLIYNIRTGSFYDFLIYPDEADSKGYEVCWALYYGNSELPQNLMADVQSLDGTSLVVAMSWNKRPIEYTFTMADSLISTREITTAYHTRWVGNGTGFEQQILTEWTQFYEDPPAVSQEDSVPQIYVDDDYAPCGPRVDGVCSGFLDGSSYKYDGGRIAGFVDLFHRHSDQSWDLLDVVVKLLVDVRRQSVSESCYNYVAFCLTTGPSYDCGIVHNTYSKWRGVQEQLFQQESDDYRGYWVCNNALGFEYRKHRQYIDGEAWTHAYHRTPIGWRQGYFPQCSDCTCDSVPTEDDFNDKCTWDKNFPPSYIDESGFSFPCFYTMDGDEMRGDDWIAIDSDTISCEYSFWEWLRESNRDDYFYYDQELFNVDGKIEFSYDDVDNVYFLDDRATEDNQGVIAAGRGLSGTVIGTNVCLGTSEYEPDFWEIHWKVCWDNEEEEIVCEDIEDEDQEYIDITDCLLECLDCTKEELLDIGLI